MFLVAESVRCRVMVLLLIFVQIALLRLKTQAVIAGRLAEMLGAVTAEVRERREVHQVGYLGEGQAFIIQIVF